VWQHIIARSISYLEDNIKAVDLHLTADDLERLNHAAPVGGRMGPVFRRDDDSGVEYRSPTI
jgi:hypothetical protein